MERRMTATEARIHFGEVMRRVVHGVLLPEEASAFLDAALRLRITLFDDAPLHRRALLMARQFGLPSTYDAHYLALAEMFGAEFWTADPRLVQAVRPALPWVRALEEVSQWTGRS